jgi:hypothetical protein
MICCELHLNEAALRMMDADGAGVLYYCYIYMMSARRLAACIRKCGDKENTRLSVLSPASVSEK